MSYPPARYTGDRGEPSGVYRREAEAADVRIGSDTMVRYVATGASTGGQFGLYKWEAQPHTKGPKPHFHKTIAESFYVLSGTIRLFDGRRWVDAVAGDFLYVPQGGIHAFDKESDDPASMLLLFVPGAPREGYFEALAEKAAGAPFTDKGWTDLCVRHDNYFI